MSDGFPNQENSGVAPRPDSPESQPNTTQNKADVLKTRRQAMAKVRAALVEETIDVVEFRIGEDAYAFELEQLREVCPVISVTDIPSSPSFVAGVINLRGQIIPIIDLRAFLSLNAGATSSLDKAVILQHGQFVVGFLADEIVGANQVPLLTLQFDLQMLCGVKAEFVRAVSSDRLIILNGVALMTDARLAPHARGAIATR